MRWFWENRQWFFSGVGVAIVLALYHLIRGFLLSSSNGKAISLKSIESGSSIVACSTAKDSNISQTVNSHSVLNSPTINVSLPGSAGGAEREKYDEWRELIRELHESFTQMVYAFKPINVITPGVEDNDYEAGIRRGYLAIRSRILIAGILGRARILEKYETLARYAVSARSPRDRSQRGCPTVTGFNLKANALEDEVQTLARNNMNVSSVTSATAESLRPSCRE